MCLATNAHLLTAALFSWYSTSNLTVVKRVTNDHLLTAALFSWDSISNLTVVKRVNKRTRKPTSRPAAGPKVVEPAGTSEWLKGTNYGQEGRSRLKKESSRKLTSSTPTSPQ